MQTVRKVLMGDPSSTTVYSNCRLGDTGSHYPWELNIRKDIITPEFITRVEEMTPNSSKSRLWKSFEHYKCFRSANGYSGATTILHGVASYWPHFWKFDVGLPRFGVTGFDTGGNEVRPFDEPSLPIGGLPGFHVRREDNGFVPEPSNLGELVQRGLNTTLPLVKSELSSINSVIELKDFKTLPRTVLNMSRLILKGRGRTLRQLIGGAADGYLQMQFNIFPLLSDISAIRRALSRLERQINDLLNRAGTPQQKHFTYAWDEYPEITEQSSDAYLVCPPFNGVGYTPNQYTFGWLTRDVRYLSSVFHVEVEYNYNYTQYQREHAHLLGLLDAFGVNFNPSIIWNALRWSFVVDWVLGVNRFLDQFKVTNMEPQINIRQCLWSIKRTRDIYLWKHNAAQSPVVGFVPQKTQLPSVKEVSYRRQVFMPGLSSIESSGLTAKEVSLAAALVISRRRRRNKR